MTDLPSSSFAVTRNSLYVWFNFSIPPNLGKSDFQIANQSNSSSTFEICFGSTSKSSQACGLFFGVRHDIFDLKGWYNENPKRASITVNQIKVAKHTKCSISHLKTPI